MTFDPMCVEVTCVTLPKDHCVQVPWEYINVCGYSDQFCKLPHTYIHTHTYYVHTTYRMSDHNHIVSYWTQFRRDKNDWDIFLPCKITFLIVKKWKHPNNALKGLVTMYFSLLTVASFWQEPFTYMMWSGKTPWLLKTWHNLAGIA